MWHTQTAVCTGRGHRLHQLPGQDRTAQYSENGVTAIALADGAGCASLSQFGANCAVQTVCQLLCRKFDRLYASSSPQIFRREVVETVQQAIAQRAEQLGAMSADLACTLLAVAVKEDSYLLFHIGDGVIAYQKQGKLQIASHPVNGEFSNTTTFVTSKQALLNARVLRGTQPQLDGFILMSDGCEQTLYRKPTVKHIAAVAPILELFLQRAELLQPQISEQMLQSVLEDQIAQHTFDDCSLAILSRSGKHLRQWNRLQPQQQALILNIATQKRSRRRHKIHRLYQLWGKQ